MRNEQEIRERYMMDGLPTRLGGLAANLARVASFSENPGNLNAVETLLEESKHFIEWTALEAPADTSALLAELQVILALWQRQLPRLLASVQTRDDLRRTARAWSDRVLTVSGLMGRPAVT